MYSIYVHTTPDGRKYVGSTSKKPKERFHGGCNYRKNTRFNDAIKLFGWDNIEHTILETVEDKKTALKREEYYTLLFRSNEPEFGYNIYVGCIPNEDSIKKHSEKMKGKHKSEETKKRISESNKGKHNHSEEERKRISESNKGKHNHSEDVKKKISENSMKPIILMNIKTKEILKFESRRSCAKFFCISISTLKRFIKCTRQIKIFDDYKVLK